MTAEEPGPGRYAPTPGAYDEIFDDAGLPAPGWRSWTRPWPPSARTGCGNAAASGTAT